MLVLTRKLQERIKIGENVTITVLRVKGNAVRIGIEAPRDVRVIRAELPGEAEAAAKDSVTAGDAEERAASIDGATTQDSPPTSSREGSPSVSPLRFPQRRMINRCGAPPLRAAYSQALLTSGAMS